MENNAEENENTYRMKKKAANANQFISYSNARHSQRYEYEYLAYLFQHYLLYFISFIFASRFYAKEVKEVGKSEKANRECRGNGNQCRAVIGKMIAASFLLPGSYTRADNWRFAG